MTAFECTTSNDASPNGSAHASPCTYGMCGYRSRKRRAVVEAERGDPLRPRVVLLEEVVRPAAALAPRVAERDLVDADVEHGRRRVRPHQFEEERELAPARAERDRIGEPHGR